MRKPIRGLTHLGRLPLMVACLLLIVLPPAIAYAEIFAYQSGTNGVGGTWGTAGPAPRDFNRVYHKYGKYWN